MDRRITRAVIVGALAVAVGSAAPAQADAGAPTSPWAGWLGSTATDPVVTLKQVRAVIGADTGAAASLTGKGVGVALIDTGVASVPGLPASRIVNGPDLSLDSQSPALRYLDAYGHGTHMAGIIVGNDTATGTKGMAPDARLTSIKVGTANGAADVSQVIAAVDWVVQHRNDDPANPIKVINLSYGSGGQAQPWNDALGFAVERAWQAGIVVVAAAGNDGSSGATALANPASNEWVLTVGAAATKGTPAVADDALAAFTNQPLRGGKQINVLAPGVSILSLSVPGSYLDGAYPAARSGDTLFRGSGTSQAAAVASGAVALLWQARPTATPDQIKEWVVRGASYIPNGIAANYGLGQLNVNAALSRTGTMTQKQSWSRSTGLGELNTARGDSRLVLDGVPLDGDATVWGPFDKNAWTAKPAWSGGSWLGTRIAGDGWTGTSWASRTWAPAVWTARPWSDAATWTDPAWEGRAWTGRRWTGQAWAGGSWTGRAWASDDWASGTWG
ncbi:S8 family serine peptidase [Paractinoplanes rishiriensis]|uniref:Peptidase S8/S53 domain-containing protein n=1 Tax=Paractinoplanes rishiriensis TaxID=1050105 RepID=A0A919N1C2_9ACTN|nr:S8 family serine peptidase [Actinoplanes rishiriensis]GIF01076.1 hypothetical protein Ari01nite_85400 [Actinoplanes rishiriensis]